jgi:hypothetical protein
VSRASVGACSCLRVPTNVELQSEETEAVHEDDLAWLAEYRRRR